LIDVGLTERDQHRLVFRNEHGSPIRRNRFSEIWRTAVERSGLPPGTGFHALRHYYASLLIRHGESPTVVQARLGHASVTQTLDTYSHLWPDAADRTREAIDAVLGDALRRSTLRERSRDAPQRSLEIEPPGLGR
jgi:integrase